jgi:hypothetical protein
MYCSTVSSAAPCRSLGPSPPPAPPSAGPWCSYVEIQYNSTLQYTQYSAAHCALCTAHCTRSQQLYSTASRAAPPANTNTNTNGICRCQYRYSVDDPPCTCPRCDLVELHAVPEPDDLVAGEFEVDLDVPVRGHRHLRADIHCGPISCNVVQCSAVAQCSSMQYNVVQCSGAGAARPSSPSSSIKHLASQHHVEGERLKHKWYLCRDKWYLCAGPVRAAGAGCAACRIMHNAYCILHTAYCALYTVHYTAHAALHTLHIVH